MSAGSQGISCECETVGSAPVNFLGDSMCKVSVRSVREIIKQYEPDKELRHSQSNTSSEAMQSVQEDSVPSISPDRNHRPAAATPDYQRINIEPPVNPGNEKPAQKYERTVRIEPPQPPAPPKAKESLEKTDRASSSDFRPNDLVYKSKTVISMIPKGVRIVTDILFDESKTNIPDNWCGNRIITETPPSKILSAFQHYSAETPPQ